MGRFFGYISSTEFYGVPLDVLAHLVVGGAIFWICRKRNLSRAQAFLTVFFAALLKELTLDLRIWVTYGFYFEPFKDIAVSLVLPVVISLKTAQKRSYAR